MLFISNWFDEVIEQPVQPLKEQKLLNDEIESMTIIIEQFFL